MNAEATEKAEVTVSSEITEKDSNISSLGDGEGVCTTGNYDAQEQMDDDSSIDFGHGKPFPHGTGVFHCLGQAFAKRQNPYNDGILLLQT